MEIISANTSHIDLIRTLAMQIWPQTYIPIIGEAQVSYMLNRFYSPEALTKQMTEQDHNFIVGYEDGEPVAFASWSAVAPAVYKLQKLYILPNLQGKGLGKAVVNYIVEDVTRRGATELRLNVNKYNHTAKSFYGKYGFRHLLDEKIDIGSGYFMDDHVLYLMLENEA